MRLFLALFISALLSFTPYAQAVTYKVDKEKSFIQFAGKHVGNPFEGTFEQWDADIAFDPEALPASSISVEIQSDSAKTGSKMYDGTLPEKDWFNAEKYPHITFKSTGFRPDDMVANGFIATGTLTIKDITKEIEFPFTVDIGEIKSNADARFSINRLDYAIGAESDPSSEWVDNQIDLTLHIEATPIAEIAEAPQE